MFVYVMEYLSDEHFTHFNTADDISGWTTADIKVLFTCEYTHGSREEELKPLTYMLPLIQLMQFTLNNIVLICNGVQFIS